MGNLIEKQQHDGEIQHYRYNAENQLTEAEIHRPGQNAVLYRYRYDPIGRRIAKVHPDGSEIQYLWDGSRLLQEYRKDRTYTYVYTEDRNYEPLAQITTYNGSDKAREILYYHNDQIGIPREMTDEEGNIVWSGDYNGWGKLTQESRLKMDIHQSFRLQNQYYDEETGLHYNFFRYYDSEIGRFTQQDPIKLAGGESLYRFAPNVNGWTDVLGLEGLPSLPRGNDDNVAGFLWNRTIDGKVRDDIYDYARGLKDGVISVGTGLTRLGRQSARHCSCNKQAQLERLAVRKLITNKKAMKLLLEKGGNELTDLNNYSAYNIGRFVGRLETAVALKSVGSGYISVGATTGDIVQKMEDGGNMVKGLLFGE